MSVTLIAREINGKVTLTLGIGLAVLQKHTKTYDRQFLRQLTFFGANFLVLVRGEEERNPCGIVVGNISESSSFLHA